jgi:hypothetical protein
MQKRGVGQDTEWRSDWPGDGSVDQDLPSKVAMVPVADTTTQNVGVAHDTFWTGLVAVPLSTSSSWPQLVPSHRLATPAVLTVAQKVAETHETSYWPPVGPVGAGPTATGADQVEPSNVTASWLLRATQNVGVAHDTELAVPLGDAGAGADQVEPFHLVALPDPSTAAQKLEVGHDTLKMPVLLDPSGWTAADQVPVDTADVVVPPQAVTANARAAAAPTAHPLRLRCRWVRPGCAFMRLPRSVRRR